MQHRFDAHGLVTARRGAGTYHYCATRGADRGVLDENRVGERLVCIEYSHVNTARTQRGDIGTVLHEREVDVGHAKIRGRKAAYERAARQSGNGMPEHPRIIA